MNNQEHAHNHLHKYLSEIGGEGVRWTWFAGDRNPKPIYNFRFKLVKILHISLLQKVDFSVGFRLD